MARFLCTVLLVLVVVNAVAQNTDAMHERTHVKGSLLRRVFDVALSKANILGNFVLNLYEENPGHVITETIAILVILYLLFRPTYVPNDDQLTQKEEDELINEWEPEPLVPNEKVIKWNPIITVGGTYGGVVQTNLGECVNFASYGFLGLNENAHIKQKCEGTIMKYGVGSCGPRGFYGTIDVHMELEKAFGKWIGRDDAIMYSDGIACSTSVITSFAKRGDLIICDEGVHHAATTGIKLSRSNVLYFKHNDMDHLELLLNNVREKDLRRPFKKLNRRFIVVEGLYQNKGDLCPLDVVVALKKKYKYRLILDDSMAIGVLGETGRGSMEHWGLNPKDVDIHVATLDTAIGSVGGICTGEYEIVDHQRLSGVGYVFSASAPPYICTAAIEALNLIDRDPSICKQVRENSEKMRFLLGRIENFEIQGDSISPVILIALDANARRKLNTLFPSRDQDYVNRISIEFFEGVRHFLAEKGVLVSVSRYLRNDQSRLPASMRILVSASHTNDHIEKCANLIVKHLPSKYASWMKDLSHADKIEDVDHKLDNGYY